MKTLILFLTASTVISRSTQNGTRGTNQFTSGNDIVDDCSHDGMCPTWFTCNASNKCNCGNVDKDAIVCDDRLLISAVVDCHCVTYDNNTGSTYTGICFYNCEHDHGKREYDSVYTELPKRPDMLSNSSVCTSFHRTGLLCGDCEDGHSPLVLSYNLSCVKCPDGHKNWWKFILVAFVPLTFFYFFVVVFNINVTSSRLHGVVWISQALSIPVLIRLLMVGYSKGSSSVSNTLKALIFFYSFWNLELFRSVLPDICLNVTTIQALALEYVVALYPFLLIVVSYLIFELHERKYVCLVAFWKPLRKLVANFRHSWNVRTSIIDSFATFFFLSYVKIISVSTDLLIPTTIYQLGSNKSTYGLYYSPSVAYFGHDHLPYAILAIIILTVFVCVPTAVFFLYPFQFFQKILSFFPVNWYFLRVFVDAYQGGYKDGTQPGTFDCRWFSAVVVFSRPLMFTMYGATLSSTYYVYATILLVILLIAMINIQPFKKIAVRYPSTDPIFLILFCLFYTAALGEEVAGTHHLSYVATTVLLLSSALVPLIYTAFLVIFWLISTRSWITSMVHKLLRIFTV